MGDLLRCLGCVVGLLRGLIRGLDGDGVSFRSALRI